MLSRGLLLISLVLAFSSNLPSGAASAPDTVVHSEVGPDHVLVAWTRADPVPDAYRVYGVDGEGASTLVAETTNLTAIVPSGFANYAVSSVFGGEEGVARPSSTGRCVIVDPNLMPPVQIVDCPKKATSSAAVPVGSLSTWLLDVVGP